jgi:NitT/TauT family transport system ATP-binding protein
VTAAQAREQVTQRPVSDMAPVEPLRRVGPAVVSVENLVMRYGSAEPVVEGASLSVAAGEVASLAILRAIAGLHQPAGGHIERTLERRDVGFLFQDDALLPWRTARQNVALGMRLRGTPKAAAHEEADHWLGRLGIAGFSDRYPRQLSGGQRKRVALAQVLSLEPKLLLMDEPFASLDAIVRHRVTQDLLQWVEGAGIAVLLVTHDLEEAQALSDTVYLLSRGPRATIRSRYEVALPRPRDLIAARGDPSFGPLLKRLWTDLSGEVDVGTGR